MWRRCLARVPTTSCAAPGHSYRASGNAATRSPSPALAQALASVCSGRLYARSAVPYQSILPVRWNSGKYLARSWPCGHPAFIPMPEGRGLQPEHSINRPLCSKEVQPIRQQESQALPGFVRDFVFGSQRWDSNPRPAVYELASTRPYSSLHVCVPSILRTFQRPLVQFCPWWSTHIAVRIAVTGPPANGMKDTVDLPSTSAHCVPDCPASSLSLSRTTWS